MKKTIVAVALVMVFVMALAAPAFAQTIVHVADYKMNGTIWMNKQVGHACNTGAEQKQTIRGEGEMTKTMDVRMVQGKLTVVDKNDFVTAANAVRNLTVTSVIELCTPPKYVYEDPDGVQRVVHPSSLYQPTGTTALDDHLQPPMLFMNWLLGTHWSEYVSSDWEAVSEQIWAAQVTANPGFSGNLHQDYEAAYGPFFGAIALDTDSWNVGFGPYLLDFDNRWRWELDTEDDFLFGVARGENYVGDYFNMKQLARTSDGEVKRYIDISSPWGHGYSYVDFEAQGFVEVGEQFNLVNLPEGSGVVTKWWKDLF